MMMKVILLLLGISCCVLGCLKTSCPSLESTYCKCIRRARPNIYCSKIQNQEKLKRTLQQLHGYSISLLELFKVNMTFVPEDLFHGLHLAELRLIGLELKDEEDKFQLHLQGLEKTLRMLMVENSFHIYDNGYFKTIKLGEMKNLNTLILNNNFMNEIGNDWFLNGPSSLTTLFFIDNRIGKLGDKVFQSLINLNYLAVTGNRIYQISRSMFPARPLNLKKLDFNNNQLRSLPSDIFSNMPSLVEVNMASNSFLTLKENAWHSLSFQLSSLYMEGNFFVCDDELKWMCKIKDEVLSAHCDLPENFRGFTISQFCKNIT